MPSYGKIIPPLRCQKRPDGKHTSYVSLDGVRVYCGLWGTTAAQELYERTIAEWIARGRTMEVDKAIITMGELAALYIEHINREYADSQSVRDRVRLSLRPLTELYFGLAAADFGPVALKCVRERMIDSGLALTSINARVATIVSMLRWAVESELIAGEVHHRCAAVRQLQRGRSRAKQPRVVKPVSVKDYEKVLPFLPRAVADALRLQRLTGARSSEILNLRSCDIDRSGAAWKAVLVKHKTAAHGKTRVLHFGPQAQAIIKPLLVKKRDTEYLFSPLDHFEEVKENAAARGGGRRENQKPSPRKTDRHINEKYGSTEYRRCIQRACVKAGIKAFHPHQLRHLKATELDAAMGAEAARVALGHSTLSTTGIYIEADERLAEKAALETG